MMAFLVVPFILLGTLAILSAWLLHVWQRFKSHSQNTQSQANNSTSSTLMIVIAITSGILGLFFRLYGFNRSLWLDEFGTLWTIEGDFFQVIQRAFSFQGQSPFYYLIVWAGVQLLGVSEIALRLPSLMFGVATGYVTYLIGKDIWSQKVGIIVASLISLSPPMVHTSADARPYALALLMTAIMFYGFARATRLADRKGRWLYIAGGVGLFSTHYLLTLIAVGIALAYLCLPALRARYSVGKFARDIGLQLLLVVWGFPQLNQLWARRAELSWLGDANYLTFFEAIGPFIIAGSIGILSSQFSQQSGLQRAMVWAFCVALFTQIACLELLAYFGVNLLERRYLVPILIPAVMIGAIALAWTPRNVVFIPLAYWLLFTGVSLAMNFKAYGTFSTAGFQDWRQAVHCVEKLARAETKPLLLYRSGFVEEDHPTNGQLEPSVTLSPLQSLRKPPSSWKLVPLTYTWSKREREDYFARSVEPAVREASVFYFLTCGSCFNKATGNYPELLLDWIERKFPARFVAEPIAAGKGITLIRFANRVQGTNLESISKRRRPATPNESTISRLELKYPCA